MTANESSSPGIGLFSGMFLIFLALKLTGHIGWSWWWVTAPLWGPVALIVVLFVTLCATVFIECGMDAPEKHRKLKGDKK